MVCSHQSYGFQPNGRQFKFSNQPFCSSSWGRYIVDYDYLLSLASISYKQRFQIFHSYEKSIVPRLLHPINNSIEKKGVKG